MADGNNQDIRRLGNSGIEVSSVAMGCWPIAGITSLDVNDADNERTLRAALDAGINFFDTAYCYGFQGESERAIGRVLGSRRHEIVIASKGGICWDEHRQRRHDARPESIIAQCDESLARLGTEVIDLHYLHAPDPAVPLAETAGAFCRLLEQGKIRSVGLSNVSVEEVEAFRGVCPVSAIQPHFNMLQREIEHDLVPHCQRESLAVVVYWPLMKGLLAGKLARDHQFQPQDGRAKYPMFQGDEWQKNQDFVDRLRKIAARIDKTVAQVVVNWTIHRPGLTVALCGAKREDQIVETAASMGWNLSEDILAEIDQALADRGQPVTRAAV